MPRSRKNKHMCEYIRISEYKNTTAEFSWTPKICQRKALLLETTWDKRRNVNDCRRTQYVGGKLKMMIRHSGPSHSESATTMTEETPTEIFLPPSFPYPIKISSIDAPSSSTVQRGARLLSYSFQSTPQGGRPETRFGTWDCAIDGDIQSWKAKAGDVITAAKARDEPIVVIQEPCKHGMQLGGLCVLCGKDMTK